MSTSYKNVKGNAEAGRFMRTVKYELLWIEEFETLWFEEDNRGYLKSSLGYRSPEEYGPIHWQKVLAKGP